jgi:rhodanese-related sulfurtransferase
MSEPEVQLSPEQVAALHESGDAVLIDVRAPNEHESAHIAGTKLIELSEVAARAGEIPRDRTVVFYCKVGQRSAMATDAFRDAGYDARNLAGGIVAWVDAGLPVEPADGKIIGAD